jgi:large subunit ribosomal protein L25
MEVATIKAQGREVFGRRAMAKVRATGQIPAVVYGRGGENVSISVPFREFSRHVWKHHKLFVLDIGGSKEDVYLQDLQWDNLNDEILHADFIRVDFNEPRRFTVPLTFVGNAKGSATGVFDSKIEAIDLECPPTALPESIRVVINDLDVGDALLVKDLPLPPNTKALSDPDEMVCNVIAKSSGGDDAEAAGEGEAEGETEGEGSES